MPQKVAKSMTKTAIQSLDGFQPGGCFSRGVWNQWNGMVEWNTGMEYWNDPICVL